MPDHPKRKEKILIVEDDSSLRSALNDKLTLKGFSPVEAKNGAEGVQFALRDRPDLILLDILMPEMDGLAEVIEMVERGSAVLMTSVL